MRSSCAGVRSPTRGGWCELRTRTHTPIGGVRSSCAQLGDLTMTGPSPQESPQHGHHESPLVNVLGPLDGARVPGGCGLCDASQTVRAQGSGVWVIDVFHDDGCPVLAKIAKIEEDRR